jgi:ATP-binding cassette subfamily B protein/subfamily B ATP-binding cassette protein MsbA
LYRELYRLLTGHRLTLAVPGIVAGDALKLIPPAATKAAIDYVTLARPVPEWVEAEPLPIPERHESAWRRWAVIVMAAPVLASPGLSARWQATRPRSESGRGPSQSVRACMRLPLHRVYQLKSDRACCARMPATWAS